MNRCASTIPSTPGREMGWECDGTNLVVLTTVEKGDRGIPLVAPKDHPGWWPHHYQEKILNGGAPLYETEDGYQVYEVQQMFRWMHTCQDKPGDFPSYLMTPYPDYDNSGDHYHIIAPEHLRVVAL